MAEEQETFLSHLVELRDRLIRVLISVGVVFVPLAFYARELYSVLDRKGYHAPWLEAKVESWEIAELIVADRRDRREMCDE